jgi:hypothetical protein
MRPGGGWSEANSTLQFPKAVVVVEGDREETLTQNQGVFPIVMDNAIDTLTLILS